MTKAVAVAKVAEALVKPVAEVVAEVVAGVVAKEVVKVSRKFGKHKRYQYKENT